MVAVIQTLEQRSLSYALRFDGFLMVGDRSFVAEEPSRAEAGGRPAGSKRYSLGVAHGRTVARSAGTLWSPDDGLQSLQPVEQGGRVGSDYGRRIRGLRWRSAND